jgi:hypothetical protein
VDLLGKAIAQAEKEGADGSFAGYGQERTGLIGKQPKFHSQ